MPARSRGGRRPTGATTAVSGTDDGATLDVSMSRTPVPGLWVHPGNRALGQVESGAAAVGVIDIERRRAISRAHTATHPHPRRRSENISAIPPPRWVPENAPDAFGSTSLPRVRSRGHPRRGGRRG